MLKILTKLFIYTLPLTWVTISTAQIGKKIRINGYSSFEFEKRFGNAGGGDANASFDADLFDLVLNIQATDRLRIAADITWEHGAATEDDRGNVAIEYAFPEYTIENWLRVRTGKMFIPFGIYNEIHTAKPAFLTVKEPLSTNKPDKFGMQRRFYPRWGSGVSLVGNFDIKTWEIDYNFQISNGEQETNNPFEEDDNKEKAFAARIRFAPTYNLKAGLSFYTDELTDSTDSGRRVRLLSYGGQLEWRINNLGFEFEYVGGSLDSVNMAKETQYGFTSMGFYTFCEKYTPYVRFEYLDPNTDMSNDEANLFVYGINIELDNDLFFKAELNTTDGDRNNEKFKGVRFTELKAAIAVGF